MPSIYTFLKVVCFFSCFPATLILSGALPGHLHSIGLDLCLLALFYTFLDIDLRLFYTFLAVDRLLPGFELGMATVAGKGARGAGDWRRGARAAGARARGRSDGGSGDLCGCGARRTGSG